MGWRISLYIRPHSTCLALSLHLVRLVLWWAFFVPSLHRSPGHYLSVFPMFTSLSLHLVPHLIFHLVVIQHYLFFTYTYFILFIYSYLGSMLYFTHHVGNLGELFHYPLLYGVLSCLALPPLGCLLSSRGVVVSTPGYLLPSWTFLYMPYYYDTIYLQVRVLGLAVLLPLFLL